MEVRTAVGTVVDGEMRDRRDTVPTADFIPVCPVSGRRSLQLHLPLAFEGIGLASGIGDG